MRRDIPADKRRAVADDYQLMSAKDVAEKHGIYFTTVYTIVRQLGGMVRVPDKRIWQNEWQEQGIEQ